MRLRAAVALFLVLLVPTDAYADESDATEPGVRERERHWGIGIGGFTALTGAADYGPVAEVEFYPGGGWGRYGGRGEVWGFEGTDAGRVGLGVTFEAGAARPRIQLALHGDVGITFPAHKATVGGGIQTQLWIRGPLAIGLDGLAFVILDGTDSTLVLAQVLSLRISY